MMQNVLILGASGTVGRAVFQVLSRDPDLHIVGTYCSADLGGDPSYVRFSLADPEEINAILDAVRPDMVVSALRGDFERQLVAHAWAAEYLAAHGGRMLYLSSANVFDARLKRPHFETDVRASKSAYGQFKIRCEDLLRAHLGDRTVIIRTPFALGRQSPRRQEILAGCESGQLPVYTPFWGNHAADLQIAETIRWILREDRRDTFHIGTVDGIRYRDFVRQLIAESGWKQPKLVPREGPGSMAVCSGREDIPASLRWTTGRLVRYLCGTDEGPVSSR